jgi:hypothetical protein
MDLSLGVIYTLCTRHFYHERFSESMFQRCLKVDVIEDSRRSRVKILWLSICIPSTKFIRVDLLAPQMKDASIPIATTSYTGACHETGENA